MYKASCLQNGISHGIKTMRASPAIPVGNFGQVFAEELLRLL